MTAASFRLNKNVCCSLDCLWYLGRYMNKVVSKRLEAGDGSKPKIGLLALCGNGVSLIVMTV